MDINLNQLYPMILSAVVALIIGKLYEKLPVQEVFTLFGKYQKGSRLKELIRIKKYRLDMRHYLYELQIAQNWFIALIVVAVVNFVFLLGSGFLKYPLWLFMIGMLPTYTIELIWLNKISYVDDLKVYQKGNPEWKKRKQRKVVRKQREKLKQLGQNGA
ncbi:hypothetical protein [Psychrobacter cryohalolentis]|uniref:Uncharacterized protein n=1 Tax=Psychrobacter cryohalolentis (strain ATCC BAA-1226 / DSM 17306 / VKM B-2378 / K5) TaxID=335284 RepID=Q1Q7R6_PSYCK|nr:hypothetical protein [Psychrobacter cryohalolentis]ABE76290.1 hypothetical protein Pcryo_2513 [Psychrobacter cryohalolentis K5]ASE25065.1 hypothetical protein CEP87_00180 [Psychrobacter cryohalolentis]